MKLRGRETKRCPRCDNICLLSQPQCADCGLVFSRLDDATNKVGKRRLKNKEKELVIWTKKAQDVKRWKLILMTICLGLFGGHYFYVGRKIMGFFMLTMSVLTILIGSIFNAFFVTLWNGYFIGAFGFVVGAYALIWMWDIGAVCFKRFKIPVSLLTEEEKLIDEEKERQEKEKQEQKLKAIEEEKNRKKEEKQKIKEMRKLEKQNRKKTEDKK